MPEQERFNIWMRQVDHAVERLGGVSVYDLPDCTFRDWFEDGVLPADAAERALKSAGW